MISGPRQVIIISAITLSAPHMTNIHSLANVIGDLVFEGRIFSYDSSNDKVKYDQLEILLEGLDQIKTSSYLVWKERIILYLQMT